MTDVPEERKRVLIITYYWPPSGGAGVQRWLKFCKYLPQFGVDPVVITVAPECASYPVLDDTMALETQIEVHRTRSFEPLRFFSALFGRKKTPYSGFSNVDTHSTFSKVSRWLRGNLFIPDPRKYWVGYAFKKALSLIDKGANFDAIITTGPPHSTHFVGEKIKRATGMKWIADFRDPWTDIYYYDQLLHSKIVKKKDAAIEKRILNGADLVLAVCPSNEMLLKEKLLNPNKLKVITNGFDPSDFNSVSPTVGVFRIGYTGTLASTYKVEPILSILTACEFEWRLDIAGVVAPEIVSEISRLGVSNRVNILGYLPHKKALAIAQNSDLLLHVVPDIAGARSGTTGKLFEYIGCQIPILNFGDKEGDSALFIDEAQAGKSFDRNEQSAVIEYIESVRDGAFKVGSQKVQRFSRKAITKDLAELIINGG